MDSKLQKLYSMGNKESERRFYFRLPPLISDRIGRYFVFRQSFGVADAGCDIIQHDPGKMKGTAEDAGFYFLVNNHSTNDLYISPGFENLLKYSS